MALRRGHDDEFTEFVAARRGQLRRTAYLLCGDWHQAEDLVQTALAKLYVAWHRVQREAGPEPYVRQILVRSHVDETRRPWRRERSTGQLPDRPAAPRLAPEDRDALLTALAELPPGQRSAVVLRHWLGLSVEETAHELGCSTGTVKSQTARAVLRLREALDQEPVAPGRPTTAGTSTGGQS